MAGGSARHDEGNIWWWPFQLEGINQLAFGKKNSQTPNLKHISSASDIYSGLALPLTTTGSGRIYHSTLLSIKSINGHKTRQQGRKGKLYLILLKGEKQKNLNFNRMKFKILRDIYSFLLPASSTFNFNDLRNLRLYEKAAAAPNAGSGPGTCFCTVT